MENNSPEPKYLILGMFLIFSGVVVFFGFFFGIFFFNDFILRNPFAFIVSFFALFLIIALIFITGAFMIQKSTGHSNKNIEFTNKYVKPHYNIEKVYTTTDYKNMNKDSNETEFCVNCGSEVFDADVYCLNCGKKV